MSVHDFSNFLRNQLIDKANEYNDILFSISYTTMEEGKRIAGIREALISIANSLPMLVESFYERK